MEFEFDALGDRSFEARALVENRRGSGAPAKVRAIGNGVLGTRVRRDDRHMDRALWPIRKDWLQAKAVWGSIVH